MNLHKTTIKAFATGICTFCGIGFLGVAGAQNQVAPVQGKAPVLQKDPTRLPTAILVKYKQDGGSRSSNSVNDTVEVAKILNEKGLRVTKSYSLVKGLKKIQLDDDFEVPGQSVSSDRSGDAVKAAKLSKEAKFEKLLKKIKELQETGLFEYVEPDWPVHANVEPTDSQYTDGTLWGINNLGNNLGTVGLDINAKGAWDLTTGSSDVIVGVIDTGVRYTHNELKNQMWVNPGEIPGNGIDDDNNGYIDDIHGINAITGSGDPMDDHDHGSHCSGTIAAQWNGGGGHAGVANGVKIMALKFLNGDGSGVSSDALECLEYAIAMGATMTSNSWGGGGYSKAMEDAIRKAGEHDMLFVVAAGNESNDNDSSPSYPASYELDNILAVAAVDNKGGIASFSNYGKNTVHVGAPGVGIYSCTSKSDSSYNTFSGTSMACPHTAGVAALVKSYYPNATYDEIKRRIMLTTTPLKSLSSKTVSGGMINATAALEIQADGNMEALVRSLGDLYEGVEGPMSVSLSDIYPVIGATVSANFEGGNAVDMFDNGIAPDKVADDGIYSGMMMIPTGVDSVDVTIRAVAEGKNDLNTVVNFVIPKPPVNDDFADRIVIAPGERSISGTNELATVEEGEPLPPIPVGKKTVWYEWRASTDNEGTIFVSSRAHQTALSVYRTDPDFQGEPTLNDLVLIGTDYSQYAYASELQIHPTPGRTYYIQIDGIDGASGAFNLITPADGAAPGAPVIVKSPEPKTLTLGDKLTLVSRAEGEEPMTYQWFLDGVKLRNATSAIYEVGSVTNKDQGSYKVTVTNDIGSMSSEAVFVMVERFSTPPANDAFAEARPISGASGSVTGFIDRATGEVGEPNHAGAAQNQLTGELQSVWFEWVAPGFGDVTINTNGSKFATVIAAYTGSSVSSLTPLAANKSSFSNVGTEITFSVVSGGRYYIAIDGVDDEKGDYTLNYQFESNGLGPVNDAFADSIELIGNTSDTGSNATAAAERDEPNHDNNTGDINSVWWNWTAPSKGSATISLEGSGYDTTMAIYTGSSVDGLTQVAYNDDYSGNQYSRITLNTEPGETYHIAVDGKGNAQGGIAISVNYTENDGQPGKVLLIDNGKYGFGPTAKILNAAGYNVTEIKDEISVAYAHLLDASYLKSFDLVIYAKRGYGVQSPRMSEEIRLLLYDLYRKQDLPILITGLNSLGNPVDYKLGNLIQAAFEAGKPLPNDLNSQDPVWSITDNVSPILNGPFGDFTGKTVSLTPQDDDFFVPNPRVILLANIGDPAKAPKITEGTGLSQGRICFWNGGAIDGQPAQPDFYDGKEGQQIFLNLVAKFCGFSPLASNKAPVARLGFDFEVEDTDRNGRESVTLDGSASTDADGRIVSYKWEWTNPNLYRPGKAYGEVVNAQLPVGENIVTLTIVDNFGKVDTDEIRIKVNAKPLDGPLLVHLKLNGNAVDSSANRLPIRKYGSPEWNVNGKKADSMIFDGEDDYLDFGIYEPLTSYSLMFWVKRGPNEIEEDSAVVTIGDVTIDLNKTVDGKRQYSYYNWLGADQTIGDANKDEWVHLAVVCNGSDTRLFYNGNRVAKINGEEFSNFTSIQLGESFGALFNGEIDDFRIYNVIKTNKDIQAIMAEEDLGDPYDQWKKKRFSAQEIADGRSGFDQDVDGDGLSNLAEYALDSDPHAHTAMPKARHENGKLVLEFNEPSGRDDIIYSAEYSDDLIEWQPASIEETLVGEVKKLRAFTPEKKGKRFLRLKFEK